MWDEHFAISSWNSTSVLQADWYLKTFKIIHVFAGNSDKKNAISWVPQNMLVDQSIP